jgi:hypothetical protein
MRVITLCAAVVVLAACAQDVVWKKPGASDQDLATDSDGCRSQAYASQGMTSDAQRLLAVYQTCMEAKGWHREQAPKP